MKTRLILPLIVLCISQTMKSQVLLNEVYTDPGSGKHEFFELYNSSPNNSPEPMNDYTLVTYFEVSGNSGFYVMDLPNLSVLPKSFFVGSAASPFNYQGVSNSTATDFNWNSAALTGNEGYLKKWEKGTANLADGNPFYDEMPLPANFNDFFYRRTGSGASYSVFLYKNGVLVNAVIFGTGGYISVIPVIIAMPSLHINMTGSTSPDFTINFSIFGTLNIETVTQDAGSDNGFIREKDGLCSSWDKSSSQVQHTPRSSNGQVSSTYTGTIAVSSVIVPGTLLTGSTVNYNVLSAPASSFPVQIQVYTDIGLPQSQLDGSDQFIASNTENTVSDGPFSTLFTPHYAHILLAVKTSAGCIDRILFVPNAILLPVKLISFRGYNKTETVKLEWKVASNEQALKFEVEKSTDGNLFSVAETITPTEKTGEEFYLSDNSKAEESVYYRLRITEKSGAVSYSSILKFESDSENRQPLTVTGNIVTDKITINIQSDKNQPAEINVLKLNGMLVAKQKITLAEGKNVSTISIPAALSRGFYVLNLVAENIKGSVKFIKQ